MPERFLHLDRPVANDIALAEQTAANLRRGSDVTHVTAQSFGEKLKKAIERKSHHMKTQQQHKEQVERERERYQQPQPRQRTKGE